MTDDASDESNPNPPATPGAEAAERFADLPAPIARALVARGFTELTAVQRAVVDAEHEGRDLRVSSQTGSGKTVAIGLALATHFLERSPLATEPPAGPAGARARTGDGMGHPRALVIVPTRELAAQVREELRWLFAEVPGATVEVVTGGTSILRERIALARRPAFVVGTPGRLLDHLRNAALACDQVEHVILDEADQMLDMGFKDELDAILEQLPAERQSHLVSATFPDAVRSLANRFQKDALALEGTKLGHANPDIEHVAYTIRRQDTYAALVNVLLLAGDSRCLLFVNRRVDATELAEKLAADGFGAAPFSGELPQAQRTRTLAAFKNGILPILVSTDVAARGIDVPEIGTVIHVDPPKNPDAYVHRSGRTGRAGRAGRSILFVVAADARKVSRMLSATRIGVAWQPVPSRIQVEHALEKRAQKQVAQRLDEVSPTEPQRMAAKQLLTERDPIELVASLVERAKPQAPRRAMELEVLDPIVDAGRGKGRGARERDSRGPRPSAREGFAPRGAEKRPRGGSFVSFSVSWGERGGATTAKLLSHVCRRGDLASHQVGAIRVFAKNALVEVASDAADAFAARAERPDERDPGITIERARSQRGGETKGGRPGPRAQHGPAGRSRPSSVAAEAVRVWERHEAERPAVSAPAPSDDALAPTGPTASFAEALIAAPDAPRAPTESSFEARPARPPRPKHVRRSGPREPRPSMDAPRAPHGPRPKSFRPREDGPNISHPKMGGPPGSQVFHRHGPKPGPRKGPRSDAAPRDGGFDARRASSPHAPHGDAPRGPRSAAPKGSRSGSPKRKFAGASKGPRSGPRPGAPDGPRGGPRKGPRKPRPGGRAARERR